MTPVGLRLQLTPDVLSKLVSAVADKFKHFVRISRTQHAGSFYEVGLRILDAYDVGELNVVDPKKRVTVTREMVGELFDLLGLFPRSAKVGESVIDVARIKDLLDDINARASAINFLVAQKDIEESRKGVLISQNTDAVLHLCKELGNDLHIQLR